MKPRYALPAPASRRTGCRCRSLTSASAGARSCTRWFTCLSLRSVSACSLPSRPTRCSSRRSASDWPGSSWRRGFGSVHLIALASITPLWHQRASMPRRAAQRAIQRGPVALGRFASCAPGFAPLLAAEVLALGFTATAVAGGVALRGDLGTAALLNLWLRTATRVLARLGEVRATSFAGLVHEASKLPFETALSPGVPVALRVSCRKSRLYHSEAVAERLHVALQERLGRPVARVEPAAEAEEGPAQGRPAPEAPLLFPRFQDDVCTVSADTSGALLHQRGYRTRPSRAPLRETLAAALLLAAGYTGEDPFVDPLCGSGTIAIEAALIARRRAPGPPRALALAHWPGPDPP